MPASINNIPSEIFIQILGDVPIEDASSVLRVNKEWYASYRELIKLGLPQLFDEIIHSHWSQWNIPIRLVHYFRFESFILDKLTSLCKSFSMDIYKEILRRIASLQSQKALLEQEETEIQRLLDDYEKSPEFEGWFPDELWKRREKNRTDIAINWGDMRKTREIYGIFLKRRIWFS